MKLLRQPGGHVQVAEAPIWTSNAEGPNDRDHLLIGLTQKSIAKRAGRGMSFYLGQLYGCVCPGLIFTEFLYQGLKRDMLVGDDDAASVKKYAACWPQPQDARLIGDKSNPTLQFLPRPNRRVFVVYISPNEMLNDFPDLFGWAEHWAWVAEDPQHHGAPIDWQDRYDKKVWAKN